jgi:hypothetical protein
LYDFFETDRKIRHNQRYGKLSWVGGVSMVKIYTSHELVNKDVILLNDAFFFKNFTAKMIGEKGKNYMKLVDGAEIIDYCSGAIKTHFGVGNLDDLSTGVKTILNVLYIIDRKLDFAVDVTECGANALECIFMEIDESEWVVPLVLRHTGLSGCSNRNFLINNVYSAETIVDLKHFVREGINC